jgi:HEAT repeat protein
LFLPDWVEMKEPGGYTISASRTLDIQKYSQSDMSWENPANLSHLDVQVRAKVSVVPFDRAKLGEVIAARGGAMSSSNQNAAEAAAKALAEIDDDRATEYFSRAVDGSAGYSQLVFISVRALARFNNDAALAALKRAAHASDDNTRHSAAGALSISPHPGAIDALLELRADKDYGVRNDVLQALAKMKSPESLQMIREMTNDPDERIRTEAVRYLKLRSDAPDAP